MLLNDEKVKEILKKYKEPEENISHYFYGVVTATFGETMLLGNMASLAHTYYTIQLTNKKIDLIELNLSCKPKNHHSILLSDVKEVKFSNWLLGMGKKITIELIDGQKIKLKANKFVAGLKKQKQNLLNIEEYLKDIELTE